MQRPGLIVFEGIDGAGTTTQAARLVEWLTARGEATHATREPSTGPIGIELRRILGGAHAPMDPAAVALLFAADRLDHLAREVEPALDRGEWVVSDRYVLSSLAYQSLELDRELVAVWNQRARPADLTLFLDVPAEVAAERRRLRGGVEELFDALALQRRVVEGYHRELALLERAGGAVVTIDGTAPADEVTEQVRRAVSRWRA
jgi:dTMP kinase